jgi:Na+-transporting NADH:ubiquinone oxidoreductase subunit NqrC
MKRILIVLSILPIVVFASLNVQKITYTLSHIQGNKEISFFNANRELLLNDGIKLTTKLNNADIVLFSAKRLRSKITIVNSYKKLKRNKNSIGAIYLKKGRTQIVFVKERLTAYGLTLSSKFNKYMIYESQLSPNFLMRHLK